MPNHTANSNPAANKQQRTDNQASECTYCAAVICTAVDMHCAGIFKTTMRMHKNAGAKAHHCQEYTQQTSILHLVQKGKFRHIAPPFPLFMKESTDSYPHYSIIVNSRPKVGRSKVTFFNMPYVWTQENCILTGYQQYTFEADCRARFVACDDVKMIATEFDRWQNLIYYEFRYII